MKRSWLAAGTVALLAGSTVALAPVPDGPMVGKEALEIQTKEWVNSAGVNTLADLRGEVVVIKQWKTG